MNSFQFSAKQYRAGMHRAKIDRYNRGESYLASRLAYGLQGCSNNYYKGYRDYYTRYCPKRPALNEI